MAEMTGFERSAESSCPGRLTSLYGRRTECGALDGVLERARTGRSAVLVIRGETGVGKTALLDYAVGSATNLQVMRMTGMAAEAELPFAALHQLCGPFLDLLGQLPGPQQAALRAVFGLEAASMPDRFLVGLAVLGLLSEAGAKRPLLCIVDDAQSLDRASAQALAFAARRLLTQPVALLFATPEPVADLAGLPELVVEGLRDPDARRLLASVVRWPLDEQVADRIVAETHGNPLALLALRRGVTAAELAGGFGLPLPAGPGPTSLTEENLLRRLRALPVNAQRLVLTAAAEPTGDVTLLWRAAERLGVGADAATAAKAAGLIELGTLVRFRHPLLRAAVYQAAALPDRRQVHWALAEATDPGTDPDRRVWHRALAAVGPDDAVADELERSAVWAQRRGGLAAAAAFLQRSAELTLDPARRATRALTAARAKVATAAPGAANKLLAMAEFGALDELQRTGLTLLRAQLAFAERRGSDAPRLLLEAARKLGPVDSGLAREAHLEALGAAIFTGRLGRRLSVLEAAAAAQTAPLASEPPRPMDLLLDGTAARLTGGYAAGLPLLRRALGALAGNSGRNEADIKSWLWFACIVAPELWDDKAWHELATRAVALARESGALAVLPMALTFRAAVHVHAGEFDAAAGLIKETDAISAATGSTPLRYASLILAAWRGEEAAALNLINAGLEDATRRHEGRLLGFAGYATAVLYNGLADYEAALTAARRACEHDDLGFFGWSMTELVEAAARSGAVDEAGEALRQLSERTRATGSQWALGIQARSGALLSDGPAADTMYREAIDRLGDSRVSIHLARAHLVYGEWLRREQKRVEARKHLRTAHDMFSQFGAAAFAERARRELQATGETAHRRTVDTHDALTMQEAQVARLAAEGHTNPEIAARLFISPRTAEYHLHKVFAKLGISSRRQLRHRPAPPELRSA